MSDREDVGSTIPPPLPWIAWFSLGKVSDFVALSRWPGPHSRVDPSMGCTENNCPRSGKRNQTSPVAHRNGCGPGGRGFQSRRSPSKKFLQSGILLYCFVGSGGTPASHGSNVGQRLRGARCLAVDIPRRLIAPVRDTVGLLYEATAEALHFAVRAEAEGRSSSGEAHDHRRRLDELATC